MLNLPALRRLLALGAIALPLAAAAYPDKPIEWVVPYPAGGGSDVVARTLAEPMGKLLGQTLVVNNKPGAATNIGADYAAKAKPDGYVMLTADTATLAANPALYAKLPYNVEKDLTPVGLMARFPMILVVNASVPVKPKEWKNGSTPNMRSCERKPKTWPSCSMFELTL